MIKETHAQAYMCARLRKSGEAMADQNNVTEDLQVADRATLSLLSVLEKNGGDQTQRNLAMHLGVALGLTNSLLKRAVRKGLLKAKQAPARRYIYYLTPKGFREKSRLVAEYLSSSLTFFRRAREEYAALFTQIERGRYERTALYGVGELAEIALLSAADCGVDICAVIHPGSNQKAIMGVPVVSNLEAVANMFLDAVVITSVEGPQHAYDTLSQQFEADRVFIAPLLHISPKKKCREGGR